MSISYDIVKSMLRTEKATMLLSENKYLFWVDKKANKIQIRKAVEDIYKVKVESVNTSMQRGKKRRVRYVQGKSPDWKKALVTLKEDSKIEVT
ncbi:MAG: 50S ribosomal protein L23 [Candidatus Omnitrophica bacterium]|nr:50S ribosomal protein L23 [Candidatus Omnitrophota bacterium]